MKGKIVINASPIILLHKADLEFLLPALFSSIIIPDGVMDEISVQKGRREIANNGHPSHPPSPRCGEQTFFPALTPFTHMHRWQGKRVKGADMTVQE